DDALRLAALLNSLPVRTFARAIAERAKDARFRFQAWSVSLLPLPHTWAEDDIADELLQLSRHAHANAGLDHDATRRLDLIVASLYGLEADELAALHEFDSWLRGDPAP